MVVSNLVGQVLKKTLVSTQSFDQFALTVFREKPPQGVVAKRLRAPNSSSAASVQQSVGSNPGRDTCVSEQDT